MSELVRFSSWGSELKTPFSPFFLSYKQNQLTAGTKSILKLGNVSLLREA